jgi:NUDIX domain-containing protein
MSESLVRTEIDRIAGVIQHGPYEGYPSLENRLRLGAAGLHLAGNTLVVPEGPWHVSGHINRQGKHKDVLDLEVPGPESLRVDGSLAGIWRNAGLILDQYNRPIHPYWKQLLADERIGLPTGIGFFWRYGPNATVDPVVYRGARGNDATELLLIKRRIGGQWAFPGGFMDRIDGSPSIAARREAGEETHLYDIGGTDEIILHKVPVGLRDTLHAWTENTVVLVHGDQDYLAPRHHRVTMQ